MENLRARLQCYKRLAKFSFYLLLLFLPIKFWPIVQTFTWLRGSLTGLSLLVAWELASDVQLFLGRAEKGLEG